MKESVLGTGQRLRYIFATAKPALEDLSSVWFIAITHPHPFPLPYCFLPSSCTASYLPHSSRQPLNALQLTRLLLTRLYSDRDSWWHWQQSESSWALFLPITSCPGKHWCQLIYWVLHVWNPNGETCTCYVHVPQAVPVVSKPKPWVSFHTLVRHSKTSATDVMWKNK